MLLTSVEMRDAFQSSPILDDQILSEMNVAKPLLQLKHGAWGSAVLPAVAQVQNGSLYLLSTRHSTAASPCHSSLNICCTPAETI